MTSGALSGDARQAAEFIGKADIVVGIPSYNNARTIAHVVRAVHAGLAKSFPQLTAVIVNSDGGSTDRTPEEVRSARIEDRHLMLFATPLTAAHRLSFPYHGIPGKGSAFRLIFELASLLDARVCAVVDADLRSISPEWIDHLLRPVLFAQYDLVTPYYHRHKYDGTITNNIVYPLTRSLYGQDVRQPIGGEFGISGGLVRRYLEREDWDTDVARYGIDIWLTTIAIAEGFRVCQSFLGAKLHDAKDPGADLSEMLKQVVGSTFALMIEYEAVWQRHSSTRATELFGFQFEVGVEPVHVRVDRMLDAFRSGCEDLEGIWSMALAPPTLATVRSLAHEGSRNAREFRFPDDLWVAVVLQYACAYRQRPLERGHLLSALTPLYLGRVASSVNEMEPLTGVDVERRIEDLCVAFERAKPWLITQWTGAHHVPTHDMPAAESARPVRKDVEGHDRHTPARV